MEYTVRKIDVYERDTFEIDEDEFIIDSESRGAHRVVIWVGTPTVQKACGVCGCEVPCEHGCCGQ